VASVDDKTLMALGVEYENRTGQSLRTLLLSSMTQCQYCRGDFQKTCTRCKGKGKVFDDSNDDLLAFGERTTLRVVKCSTCRGKGELFCRYCSKRRFSREGLALSKRLALLFAEEDKDRDGEPGAVKAEEEHDGLDLKEEDNKAELKIEGDPE
jgi:DnaJ-class molecular chaperone